ncbi:MAG TPA: CRISPR-associated endonuclease Cas1, partial [Chloroflexota bacterium]|nr:CRISPR-associated endonuclease Cas1 [Chloroflexota bacterium]
ISLSAAGGIGDPRIRRAQALALSNAVGLEIGRELLRGKLQGQVQVLGALPWAQDAQGRIQEALRQLDSARHSEDLRGAEAFAAGAYWKAWAEVPVRFLGTGAAGAPEHWKTFGQRRSPISDSPRLAANPANALLNYLYGLAEAEAVSACLTLGLDPGLGVVHMDHPSRNSLALDLMEVVRPHVDAWVLTALSRGLQWRHFHETRQGVCRVLPPLTLRLAETAPGWADLIAPAAELARVLFAESPGSRVRDVSTPLSQSRRKGVSSGFGRPIAPLPVIEWGASTPPDTTWNIGSFGRSRSYGGDAARKRRESIARRTQEAAAWEAAAERIPDPSEFAPILKAIQAASVAKLMRATGLSRTYCEQIKSGRKVPHPRHWGVLLEGGRP